MHQPLRIVMSKSVAKEIYSEHPLVKNQEYVLSKLIDKFLYETGGCIPGWSRHIDIANDIISYTCSTEDRTEHRSDLSDFIDKIKKEHAVEIIGDPISSEIVKVYFEE